MRLLAAVILAVLAVSCGRQPDYYQEGLELLMTDKDAAAGKFQIALALDKNTPESHYQLGLIYAEKDETSMLAVWHLRQFLKLKGEGADGAGAEIRLADAERRASAQLNTQNGNEYRDDTKLKLRLLEEHAARQKMWLQELSEENVKLRRQLGELKSGTY